MVVAIDGPAGVGKSTLAKAISKNLGYIYLNTGKFYRAITYLGMEKKLSVADPGVWISLALDTKFELCEEDILVNSLKLGEKLHTGRVDSLVSQISAIPEIRGHLNLLFRKIAKNHKLVVEGRDMTTEVFPEAEYRFYLDANPEIRAKRRLSERPEGKTYQEILTEIQQRDERDRNKTIGKLVLKPGVHYIDTSDLTIQQVCEKVERIILEKF